MTPARNGLRAVLFDWDGTLVDSAEKTYACYVRVFAAYGIAFDHAAFERTYSPDWYRTYQEVGLSREHWPDADARWLSCYATEPSRLLPGVRETLERLAEAGPVQGIVSSGDGSRVRREIQDLGLARFFAAVVCGGETACRKPHPEPLLLALERLGVPPGRTAYVGDSPEDVAMARSAGVVSVGIPGRFPNREALAASTPDVLALSLDAAVDALLR
ncbi:MAG TPA: HAD family hydrolase [Vicinamibacteria bacterium]|nr:HAD family hydrolase [Vicinamibacteria bacterium]